MVGAVFDVGTHVSHPNFSFPSTPPTSRVLPSTMSAVDTAPRCFAHLCATLSVRDRVGVNMFIGLSVFGMYRHRHF